MTGEMGTASAWRVHDSSHQDRPLSRSGEVPVMTASDHFERVASIYESLRTTDEVPVRWLHHRLPSHPVLGVDVGCGTGRYSKLLGALLPEGSLLAACDASAMPRRPCSPSWRPATTGAATVTVTA